MRFFRGLLMLTLISAIVLLVGSYYMRRNVIKLLENRALVSSSLVLSRPFPITPNMDLLRARLVPRLNRLGYQEVAGNPQHSGEYHHTSSDLTMFIRSFQRPDGSEQGEQIIRLRIGKDQHVTEIEDLKFKEPIAQAYLPPEIISVLGDSAVRASEAKRLFEFPQSLIDALLSIEDERFYSHIGIDPISLLRATIVNLRAGSVRQGGSTLSQQLVKNLFFDQERTFKRKLYEAFSAILIETAFTKDQILEFYLNEVFLGQEGNTAIHGFGEAALSFFGKDVNNLSILESAVLAGLVKAPTKYSPRRDPERAKERAKLVLDKMLELGKISQAKYSAALNEKLDIKESQRTQRVAPYFVDYLRKQLELEIESAQSAKRNLRVHTGLDREMQLCAQHAVENGSAKLESMYKRLRKRSQPLQVALMSISPSSSEVRAWVGGRDYRKNQFDRISLAHRQPGSAFKPIVYLTALDKSLNAYRVARTTSLLDDEPITLEIPGSKEWSPENYDKEYRGEITLRQALVESRNIPTVNLALKVGIPAVKHTAQLLGFPEDFLAVPSLALGAVEVTPLELARAYNTLANGGLAVSYRPIVSLTIAESDHPLFTAPLEEQRVASEPAVYVLTTILEDVVTRGTAASIRTLGYKSPAAGKTGTTNDARDAWFVGFTPRLTTLVWVGFDDNSELGLTGAQAAVPIWAEYMQCVEGIEPTLDFLSPEGVVKLNIDTQTGLLATPSCPISQITQEVFVEGQEPITPCTLHGGAVDSVESEEPATTTPGGLPPAQTN